MIYVGIDVAKDKHDCFAMNSDGEILIERMTIQNNLDGFNSLFNSISQFNESFKNIVIGNGFVALLSKNGLLYVVEYNNKLTMLYNKYFLYK